MQQLNFWQDQRLLCLLPSCAFFAPVLRQPLNEFPICGRKQLLFMGSPGHQVEQLCQGLKLFSRARARQVKLDAKPEPPWLVFLRHCLANHSQSGARRIQMRGRGRGQPVLQVFNELPFLCRLLDLRKTGEIGIGRQFRRQGALGPQEKKSQFLQPGLALG